MKHFDYLPKYDDKLNEMLGLDNLSSKVADWRTRGLDDPEMLCVFCRKTIEIAIRNLLETEDAFIKLDELIRTAEDENIIPKPIIYKCQEIRRKGNNGAHASVSAFDAKMAFELLDDVIRWFIGEDIDPAYSNPADECTDSVFIAPCVQEADDLVARARTAAALSKDDAIEKAAINVRTSARKRGDQANNALEELSSLIQQAQAIAIEDSDNEKSAQEQLFDICDEKLELIRTSSTEPDPHHKQVADQVEKIIGEHDFIKKLLKGGSTATDAQLAVMAFPKSQDSATNILQVAGGAGTGKTLCLLAKIISEIDDHGQGSLFNDIPKKNALFVCFNKRLANYVKDLLASYPDDLPDIEVTHYDEYVNQLVREYPKEGYEHLARYASSSRYHGWSLCYSNSKQIEGYLKESIDAVAAKRPNQKGAYYLDSVSQDNVSWINDEIRWLEAKFDTPESASEDYLTTARTGRGTKRRPDTTARAALLEIWAEFRKRLADNNLYTIEQATKRLLVETDLPKYDAIAIDEVQDLSLISVKMLLRLRRTDKSNVFISGDENQKIYQRDFTWKELDSGVRGYTITLQQNKRNSPAIHSFSNRLLGEACPHDLCSKNIHIKRCDDETVLLLIERLLGQTGSSIALIGNPAKWEPLLMQRNIPYHASWEMNFTDAGLHLLGVRAGKGLEFDCVVVDYTNPLEEDEAAERNLRYVHFTRARYRLYIRYETTAPALLKKYYPDFLCE